MSDILLLVAIAKGTEGFGLFRGGRRGRGASRLIGGCALVMRSALHCERQMQGRVLPPTLTLPHRPGRGGVPYEGRASHRSWRAWGPRCHRLCPSLPWQRMMALVG